MGLIPGSGRSPWGGRGNPLQCSCLENPMNRRDWRTIVQGVTKSQTRLKWLSMHTCDLIKDTQSRRVLWLVFFLSYRCCKEFTGRSNGEEKIFVCMINTAKFILFILAMRHGLWDLPWPGIKPVPLTVRTQSPNHWTTRKFPSTECMTHVPHMV